MWNVGWFYSQAALTQHDKKSYEALLFTGDQSAAKPRPLSPPHSVHRSLLSGQ
jgi:hypothetical protein